MNANQTSNGTKKRQENRPPASLSHLTLQPLQESREFLQLVEALRTKEPIVGAFGLTDPQKPHFAAALQQHRGGQLLLLTETEAQARQLAEDLSFYMGTKALLFPARQPVLYETIASDVSTGEERLKTLQFLSQQQPAVITAPMEALYMKLPPPALFSRLCLTFTLGEVVDREAMLRLFLEQGYQRMDQVEEKGQYSIRGDIVDIFPPTEEMPCRIELFDDEVDSIRYFDLMSQQSVEKIQRITIYPATEWVLEEGGREKVIDRLKHLSKSRKAKGDPLADTLPPLESDSNNPSAAHSLLGREKDNDVDPRSLLGREKDNDVDPRSLLGREKDNDVDPHSLLGREKDNNVDPHSLLGREKDNDVDPLSLLGREKGNNVDPLSPLGREKGNNVDPLSPLGRGQGEGLGGDDRCAHLIARLTDHWKPHDLEGLQDLAYDTPASLLDYLAPDSLVLLDEPQRLRNRAEGVAEEWKEHFAILLERQQALPVHAHCLYTPGEITSKIKEKTIITLHLLPRNEREFPAQTVVNFVTRSLPSFHGKMNWLFDELRSFTRKDYQVVLLAANKEKALKLLEAIREAGVPVEYRVTGGTLPPSPSHSPSPSHPHPASPSHPAPAPLPPGKVTLLTGSVNRGFEYVGFKYLLLSDYEVFGAHKRKTPKPKRKDARAIQSFVELKPGGYVVHENHGIGRYEGIESLTVDGITRDYLKISYAGADHLYVPTDQMDLIQKYIGSEDKPPRMNRLGGTDWAKTKGRVKKAIEDMADELLELYAKRNKQKGHAFAPDTEMQQQFEYLFPYEETPDQQRAIDDVKADMESERPMDRLLCGDVGYGKTEVALRAAFKCVADSKQCAVLVPTTILAQQHFNTFRERFSPFPVRVEMLSRFRSPKQIQKIIKDIKNGLVDVVIGTHRLLSKDVVFKDLGLLVVDEEQRFGVKHKERIKQLKANVDVLTLTATPIPRTLHMAMSGIRDMSIIEDPPEERVPVQTYVVAWNPSLVADAILRETARGGQVYYLYNRVEGIYTIANQLADRFPELNIGVGHGQMNETELEKVMLDYYEGRYDVLVCTTIIENGLDIPNANTILVHDADRLGLSQLYQLRGRVGRSTRQAYAYLMFQRDKILSEVAEKRLKAIKEFTEFGSGFKIAMRDLEIRGAGNLLGGEQHGHMAAIGYDLYVKLLEETMQKTRGEAAETEPDVTIELNVNAYIPKEYIRNAGHKIEIYKKIAAIRSREDQFQVEEEIEDRFGDIPGIVRNLLTVATVKGLALKAGITSIVQKEETVRLQFGSGLRFNPEAIAQVIHEYGNRITFNAGQQPYFTYKIPTIRGADQLLRDINTIVEILSGDAAA